MSRKSLLEPREIDAFFEPPEGATPQERRLWSRARNVVHDLSFRGEGEPMRGGIQIFTAQDLLGIELVGDKLIRHVKSGCERWPSTYGSATARVLRVIIKRAQEACAKPKKKK